MKYPISKSDTKSTQRKGTRMGNSKSQPIDIYDAVMGKLGTVPEVIKYFQLNGDFVSGQITCTDQTLYNTIKISLRWRLRSKLSDLLRRYFNDKSNWFPRILKDIKNEEETITMSENA